MLETHQDCEPQTKRRGRPRKFDRLIALERALEIFWHQGYEPVTIANLCEAMEIKVPSLYAAFGSKANLFLEAVRHYEEVYWDAPWRRLEQNPDVFQGIEAFFIEAAGILSSMGSPRGCMVILGATNVAPGSFSVDATLKLLRRERENCLLRRVRRAAEDGQIPSDSDAVGIAAALNTLLEGMSVKARDGASNAELAQIAKVPARVLRQPF